MCLSLSLNLSLPWHIRSHLPHLVPNHSPKRSSLSQVPPYIFLQSYLGISGPISLNSSSMSASMKISGTSKCGESIDWPILAFIDSSSPIKGAWPEDDVDDVTWLICWWWWWGVCKWWPRRVVVDVAGIKGDFSVINPILWCLLVGSSVRISVLQYKAGGRLVYSSLSNHLNIWNNLYQSIFSFLLIYI